MSIKQYDAVVVGAALGGLISAALLAKRGYKVAVIEKLDQPGGRVGGTEYNGYWIDLGHRDGHGYGDGCWVAYHGLKAAKEVGLDLRFHPYYQNRDSSGDKWRQHVLPKGEVAELSQAQAMGEVAGDPIENYKKLAKFFGLAADDKVAAAADIALNKLKSIDDAVAWEMIEVTLGDWLTRNVESADARNLILQMAENSAASPAEHASVGRFIFVTKGSLHFNDAKIGWPDDPEVGGCQAIIMPWVRAIRDLGGEIWLGWKPQEIVVANRHVTGVVALDKSGFVDTFEAPIVITDYDHWDLPQLIEECHLPRDFVAMAEKVREFSTQTVCWWAGLKRLPRLRRGGTVEDHLGWQRIVYGNGSVKSYHGGWHFPSVSSPKSAPPGKHLIALMLPAHGEQKWINWSAAKSAIDVNLDYLKQYYLDLEECVDWARYQYFPTNLMGFYLKPVPRLPVKVSTIKGLYVASASAEGTSAWIDKEAEAAIEAADLVEAEFGKCLKRKSSNV